MLQALVSAGGVGTLGAFFLLGMLYERKRHVPAPMVHRILLSIEPPEHPTEGTHHERAS